MKSVFYIYLLLINVIAFAMYFDDKNRAMRHKWRISEAALIGVAVIGGSIGAILGMRTFRHKTKHLKFKLGLPAILFIQLVLLGLAKTGQITF